MYGGKLINKICKDCTLTILKILKSRKVNTENTMQILRIRILRRLAVIFSILSELDSKLYEAYLRLRKQNFPRKLINYVPILSIYFSSILILIIHKTKFPKSLSIDCKIIKIIILSCIRGNIGLIRENIESEKV